MPTENVPISNLTTSKHGELLNQVIKELSAGDLDHDSIFISASKAKCATKGVDAKHLAKVWKIDLETAERTIDVTSQRCRRVDDPKLSKNYSTSERMLRYRRIKEYFYMDTFFSKTKGRKLSRGHTCCQLFVTDCGFIHVVPMRSKLEVISAMKEFVKTIGAPDAIVSDSSGEQKSKDVRKFLSDIGTTLRLLEEGTPWANTAELYIWILKEVV